MTVGMKPGHQARFVKRVAELSRAGTRDERTVSSDAPRSRFSFSGFRSRGTSAEAPMGITGSRARGTSSEVPGITTTGAGGGETEGDDYFGSSASGL